MITRRDLLAYAICAGVATRALPIWAVPPKRIVFIHGRSQEGKNPVSLKETWVTALRKGAEAANLSLPADLEFIFPYYGDTLDEFTRQSALPLTGDIQARGESAVNEDYLLFQAEIAEELRQKSGITDQQIDQEYGDNLRERGPLNWEWVQAILRAIDRHSDIGQIAIEQFTRDVYLYTHRSLVQETIDNIILEALEDKPAIVVSHSLGTVVSYNVLRDTSRQPEVPLFVTLGSPLAIRAIRNQFRPLSSPTVGSWFNAFDVRDVVALYPLDSQNFPVAIPVENFGEVNNHTDNRHGITGYLDDPTVARQILEAT